MYENILSFVKNEFNDLNNRAKNNGKLNMQEVQYADLLAHFKKNLLTGEAMEKSEESHSKSYGDGYADGYSDGYRSSEGYRDDSGYGARGRGRYARRDSMGRYADEAGSGSHGSYQHDKNMIGDLHELMNNAPNEQIKHKYMDFINEIQEMM